MDLVVDLVYVLRRMQLHRFQALPIQFGHALGVYRLPDFHRHLFDRLLVAQSQLEDIPIVTSDAGIARYEVGVIW